MEFDPDSRNEAERLLGIADKLLEGRDLHGAKEFATLAQETDPLLDGSDQMVAISDVLLASEKRVNNYYYDWYAVLQMERRSDEQDLIKKQYRRLALLLHPDKNKYPYANQAFSLVSEAWAVLSDPTRKPVYDREVGGFSKVDLPSNKLPVKRSVTANTTTTPVAASTDSRLSSFWTGCPYCYRLYEYPRVYEECCLRCQNCKRAFHAVLIPSLPPMAPGKEAYYCSWGPLPFAFGPPPPVEAAGGPIPVSAPLPNWMPPPPFPGYIQPQPLHQQAQQPQPQPLQPQPQPLQQQQQQPSYDNSKKVGVVDNVEKPAVNDQVAPRKRGRPRKNPI